MSLTGLKFITAALTVGALGFIGQAQFHAFEQTSLDVEKVGYANYFKIAPKNGIIAALLFKCSISGTDCSKFMNASFEANKPNKLNNFAMLLPLIAGAVLLANLPKRNRKLNGYSRWATLSDLKEMYKPGIKGDLHGYIGLHTNQMLQLPQKYREGHILVHGGIGAGKTTGYFFPNMLLDAHDNLSAIVWDLKFPDLKQSLWRCVDFFRAYGRPVHLFTPFNEDSVRMPLLSGVKTFEDAMEVAGMFVTIVEDASKHFKVQERTIMASLIYMACKEESPSIGWIQRRLSAGSKSFKTYVGNTPDIFLHLGTVLNTKDETLDGMLGGLAGDLLSFANPVLDRATSGQVGQEGVLDLRTIFEEAQLLYFGINQSRIQSGSAQIIIRLFKRLMDKTIFEVAGAHGGSVPVPTSVYIDEFANFGRIPGMMEALATMRSRSVTFHLGMQSRAQGIFVYGRDEWEAILANNVQTTVMFPASYNASTDAKDIEEMLDVIQSWTTTKSVSGRGFETTRGQTEKGEKQYLLTKAEMWTFPEGEAVIKTLRCPPIRSWLGRLDQHRHPLHALAKKVDGIAAKLPPLLKDREPASAPVEKQAYRENSREAFAELRIAKANEPQEAPTARSVALNLRSLSKTVQTGREETAATYFQTPEAPIHTQTPTAPTAPTKPFPASTQPIAAASVTAENTAPVQTKKLAPAVIELCEFMLEAFTQDRRIDGPVETGYNVFSTNPRIDLAVEEKLLYRTPDFVILTRAGVAALPESFQNTLNTHLRIAAVRKHIEKDAETLEGHARFRGNNPEGFYKDKEVMVKVDVAERILQKKATPQKIKSVRLNGMPVPMVSIPHSHAALDNLTSYLRRQKETP